MPGRFQHFAERLHVAVRLYEIGSAPSVLWAPTVSLAVAAAAGFWTWAAQWGYLPIFLVGLGVFTVVLWGVNGLIWLQRQRRPSRARVSYDYSYALASEEVIPSLDLENNQNTLKFRLAFTNVANGALKYHVEKLQIFLEDRFATARIGTSVIPRATRMLMIPNAGFGRGAFDSFPERTHGHLEYSIIYGHPEDPYSWRSIKSIELHIKKSIKDRQPNVGLIWIIRSESEEALP